MPRRPLKGKTGVSHHGPNHRRKASPPSRRKGEGRARADCSRSPLVRSGIACAQDRCPMC